MPLPATMKAISISHPGGPECLVPTQIPRPQPGEHEILIEVFAAGVNRPDILQRMGLYPPPMGAPKEPGLEVAGKVAALGARTSRFKIGDRVCALLPGGGYAQYALARETSTLPMTNTLSFEQAAALPETFFTVWSNLFDRAQLKKGETLLVHGGASGIGTTAIQMARAMGARVFATASSQKKCKACLKLGAELAINYLQDDFVSLTRAQSEGKGVDVILDMVGGDYIERNFQAAAKDGRIALIGFMGAARAEVNFMPLLLKRLTLTGSTLRARPDEDKEAIAKALEKHIWPCLESGRIKPWIDRIFPMDEAAKAHSYMESGRHIGKIVLVNPKK